MKKTLNQVAFATIVFFLITSCQKKDLGKNPAEGSLIEQARAYFNKEVLSNASATNLVGNARQKNPKTPLWEKAHTSKSGGLDIVYVPLKYEDLIGMKSEMDGRSTPLEQQSYLVVRKDQSGKFSSNVTTVVPSECLKNNSQDLTAIVLIEDWFGNSRSKYALKDGKLRKFKQPTTSLGARTESTTWCAMTDYYYCHVDNSGNYNNCTYLFSEILYCWEEGVDPYDSESGGGEGDVVVDCNVPDADEVLSHGAAVFIPIEQSTSEETDYTRNWSARWIFYEGSFLTYNWSYISHDVGTQKKAENGPWKWETISHSGETTQGTTPFSTSLHMGSAVTYIFPDKSRAKVTLSFEVKICIECGGINFGCKSQNYTNSGEWNAN